MNSRILPFLFKFWYVALRTLSEGALPLTRDEVCPPFVAIRSLSEEAQV
jgi:hypothetical protein